MIFDKPLSQKSEVVDTKRRFTPDWYSWLSKLIDNLNFQINVSPEAFGAKGSFDITTGQGPDDAPAWNAMLNYIRTQTATLSLAGDTIKAQINCRPGAVYRLNSTLNFTGLRTANLFLYGNGCAFFTKDINDQAVFDAIWSLGITFQDFVMIAPNGALSGTGKQPRYGIVIGRRDNDDASLHRFRNVRIYGWYNYACLLGISSELIMLDHCHFGQSTDPSFVGSVMSGLALHLCVENEPSYSSPFQTIGTLPSFGFGNWAIFSSFFQSAQGGAIRIQGPCAEIKFYDCYGQTNAHPIVRLLKNHNNMQLEMHTETGSASSVILMDAQNDNCEINGLILKDGEPQPLFIFDSIGSNNRNIFNGDILIPSAFTSTIKIFKPGSGINFHGKINIGSDIGINDISGANSFRGEIYTTLGATSANGPINNFAASGYITVYSFADSQETHHPSLRLSPVAFSAVSGSPVEGTLAAIIDSTTNVWGATITGGGTNHVLGYYDGTNWTVAGT